MKMDFPQVDLPTEVLAWTNVTEDILNIYKQSCRLQACIVAICTEGSMKASINLLDYEIHPNDLITLLPGTIIQFRDRTEKVCLCFAGFSAHCAGRINLMKNIGNAYPKLIEQPVVPLNEEVASYLKDYFALLSRASCNENFEMDSELVELSLQTILTSIRLIYHKFPGENGSSNRKKEICSCYHITKGDVADAVEQGASTFKEVKKMTKAGKACGDCKKKVKKLIKKLS